MRTFKQYLETGVKLTPNSAFKLALEKGVRDPELESVILKNPGGLS